MGQQERTYQGRRLVDALPSLIDQSYSLVADAFERAYSNGGDDTEARDLLENMAEPLIYASNTDKDVEVEAALGKFESVKDEDSEDYDFNIKPYSYRLRRLYNKVKDTFEPDEFDQIVGVFASGIAPMSVAGAYLEGDEVLVRYSHEKKDDSEVMMTNGMEDRADFAGSKLLITDDTLYSGETFAKVGRYLLDRGASEIYAIPLLQGDQRFEPESLDLFQITRTSPELAFGNEGDAIDGDWVMSDGVVIAHPEDFPD